MIEVVAPATLPENYTFNAEFGGRSFTVVVPQGGVEEGQKFSVPMPGGADNFDEAMMRPRISVPVGHWRDGVCDIFTYGCCHVLLWNSIFCVPVTVAQVMTRMKLSWLGKPGNAAETAGTFRIIASMVMSYFVLDRLLGLYIFGDIFLFWSPDYPDQFDESVIVCVWLRRLLFCAYFLFGHVYILMNVRAYIREKYAIPEQYGCPSGCEDACCSCFCSWCTVAQIARHTTDYDTYRATCCSETGLPEHVPAIV